LDTRRLLLNLDSIEYDPLGRLTDVTPSSALQTARLPIEQYQYDPETGTHTTSIGTMSRRPGGMCRRIRLV